MGYYTKVLLYYTNNKLAFIDTAFYTIGILVYIDNPARIFVDNYKLFV